MFLQPYNKELFAEAFNDFSRRLKWRLYFALSGKGNNEDYDPDYEVQRDVSHAEPALPQYLNSGLNKGREYVYNTISKAPREVIPNVTSPPRSTLVLRPLGRSPGLSGKTGGQEEKKGHLSPFISDLMI